MSLCKDNWQTTKPTIRERTMFLLNNDLFSDVKFVVRKNDGESESEQAIPAHKFVLSIGSPVFEAMFYGELAETRDSIEVPDCEYESLLELLRYMYSDEVDLSGSNVMGVLYLAKKYMVPSLAEKCTKYLRDHLDASNAFSILPSAQKYEEEQLVDCCWEAIDEQTEAAVKSDAFVRIERSLLEALVERDTLNIAEVELFKGVVEWAKQASSKQGRVADGQEKRTIIGEQVIQAIRFPLMKLEEFASVVMDSKILTYDEVAIVIKCFSSVEISSGGFKFPVTKRSGPCTKLIRCRRFNTLKFGWKNSGQQVLYLSVNRDILFHGVHLFGSKDNTYSVNLLLISPSFALLASKEGIFTSVSSSSGEYYGFDVLFEKPVALLQGIRYILQASVNGALSWYGIQGDHTHICSDVIFTLQNYYLPTENTNRYHTRTISSIHFQR